MAPVPGAGATTPAPHKMSRAPVHTFASRIPVFPPFQGLNIRWFGPGPVSRAARHKHTFRDQQDRNDKGSAPLTARLSATFHSTKELQHQRCSNGYDLTEASFALVH